MCSERFRLTQVGTGAPRPRRGVGRPRGLRSTVARGAAARAQGNANHGPAHPRIAISIGEATAIASLFAARQIVCVVRAIDAEPHALS